MRLLLMGCTGFIGRELVPQLLSAGHHVTLISRKNHKDLSQKLASNQLILLQKNPADATSWQQGELLKVLAEADGVINLAGEPIAEKRWSASHCKELEDSRIETTKGLTAAMCQLKRPPGVLVNASAIGYYGTSQDCHYTEENTCGEDFLASLCKKWETAAQEKPRATRLVVFRIGIVLGPDGGALGKMLPVFKTGLGGPIGNGSQWMSWIHRTDLCQMVQQSLINKSWSGIVNAVAPKAVSMGQFASVLGKSLGRPSLLPIPGAILKLLLGDGARVVLEGQHVNSIRLQKLGFKFQYPELNEALTAITKPY